MDNPETNPEQEKSDQEIIEDLNKQSDIIMPQIGNIMEGFKDLRGEKPAIVAVSVIYQTPNDDDSERNEITYRHEVSDPKQYGSSIKVGVFGALHLSIAMSQALRAETSKKNRNHLRRLVASILQPLMVLEQTIAMPGDPTPPNPGRGPGFNGNTFPRR